MAIVYPRTTHREAHFTGVTLLALLAFGAVKARFTGVPMLRGAVQTVVVGGVAAGVAYGLARLVSQFGA